MITFFLCSACSVFSQPIFAETSNNPTEIQQQLKALEAEINKFRALRDSTENERSEIENNLRNNEQDINNILNKINTLQQDINQGKEDLSALNSRKAALQMSKNTQQKLIREQVRASYQLGNQQYLKVVLNQQDPDQLSRMLKYYNYFNHARLQLIDQYEQTLNDQLVVEQQIVDKNHRLVAQQQGLNLQKTSLLGVQQQQKINHTRLVSEIKHTGNQIALRQKDRQQLETLLENIIANIVNLVEPEAQQPFADLFGELTLPVAGNIAHRFGSRKTKGKLHGNGIFIAASAGQPVHAVHLGRVVFSDWLRGFGLLLIINHGEGYMSLYGHNQVLYQETGAWVQAGQLIAGVGNTGGQTQPGLYFEIRKAGIPSDPQSWCRTRAPKRNRA